MYFFDPDHTYVSDTSTLLGHKTRNIFMSFFCCFFVVFLMEIIFTLYIYIYISIKFSQLEHWNMIISPLPPPQKKILDLIIIRKFSSPF